MKKVNVKSHLRDGTRVDAHVRTISKPKPISKSPIQRGKSNLKVDKRIKALHSGKRISKSGNTYWETRKNRSDVDRRVRL
jgi:hypothetical protein